MFATLFALLGVIVILGSFMYESRKRTRWVPVGQGLWMQRRTYKNKAFFIFRTSSDIDPTSQVPALWKIKKPFSDNPKYITQHEDQLRAWWEPLKEHYAGLGRDPKAIKAISFAPTLGIYLQVDSSHKTQRVPEEDLVVMMLEEAQRTWKPRRFDVDTSYHIRESLMQKWHYLFSAAIAVVIHGVIHYRYVDFLSDSYYTSMGIGMALLGAAAFVFWFYPKMEGSVHRLTALGQIAALVAVCLGISIPYLLIGANMLSLRTVCEQSVPVTQWYSRSGKTRTYYAVLDLQECSTAIPARDAVQVTSTQYQHGTKMDVRVSRGALGRYVLETK